MVDAGGAADAGRGGVALTLEPLSSDVSFLPRTRLCFSTGGVVAACLGINVELDFMNPNGPPPK